jgi:hypothetical protein
VTDKEILEEVYKQLKIPVSEMPVEYRAWVWKAKLIQKFIEDEWERRDDPDFVPTKGLRNEVRVSMKPSQKGISIRRERTDRDKENE